MSQLELERRLERAERRRGGLAVVAALLLIAGLVFGVVAGGAYVVKRLLPATASADYPGPGSGRVVVEVVAGQSQAAIGRTLATSGVVKTSSAFVEAATANPESTSIQPGTYALLSHMKASDALTRLLDPSARIAVKVVVREGLRLKQTFAALASPKLPASSYAAAAKNRTALKLPAYAKGNPEGLLFPATYDFPPAATAAQRLAAMVARYGQSARSTGLAKGATIDGRTYTPYQLLVLASILEKEARPADMPKVARVLYNRLAKGTPLELDSTVSYVTGKPGVDTTPQDRASRSPYNTYRRTGLPPAPIDSPGDAAMKAAVSPVKGPWTYFVVVNLDTGETRFATSFSEHLRNVRLYQKWAQAHSR